MKVLYLFSDTMENPDHLKTVRYGVCIANNQIQQFLSIPEDEFFDLMQELNKLKLIIKHEGINTSLFKRVRFWVDNSSL